MRTFDALVIIPLLPLLGAFILGVLGRRMDRPWVHGIALATVFGAFTVTAMASFVIFKKQIALETILWTWIRVGRYSIDLAFGLDALSATLLLVVTGVGFLIHLYSIGYMAHDPSFWRFFSYLNLFIFAMSILVLGRSLPVLFIGWEGVGLASYLLIGFWYSDENKAKAGRKAFIVNRVGDFGFLIGMFILIGLFGTLDFVELNKAIVRLGATDAIIERGMFEGFTVGAVITAACLFLFVGATGKSAQLPLYIWLPDAMAGPTPVSALIHAATMVTAGVYMICRLGFLYDLAPMAQDVVAWVGAATAVFAATIGLAQNDIKKVLAYSTISQLGYMFLAAGVGAYAVAMFHLVTHAFFKACLFLGSGAVIHALHDEQDMRRMGALASILPPVYVTFGISTLALAGFPGLSGFFSKDAIIAHAFEHTAALGILGLIGAALTAFYMARLVSLTFFGDRLRHPDPSVEAHIHHPGVSMTLPLWILAILALIGGVLNLPGHTPFSGILSHALEPIVGHKAHHATMAQEVVLMGSSAAIAILCLLFGFILYRKGPPEALDQLFSSGPLESVYCAVFNKWYVDEIYDFLVVRPLRFLGSAFAMLFDPWVIDGLLVRATGLVVKGTGTVLRQPQTGSVQTYATFFVIAAAIITGWALW